MSSPRVILLYKPLGFSLPCDQASTLRTHPLCAAKPCFSRGLCAPGTVSSLWAPQSRGRGHTRRAGDTRQAWPAPVAPLCSGKRGGSMDHLFLDM